MAEKTNEKTKKEKIQTTKEKIQTTDTTKIEPITISLRQVFSNQETLSGKEIIERANGLKKETTITTKNSGDVQKKINQNKISKENSPGVNKTEDSSSIVFSNGVINKQKLLEQQKNKPLFIKSYYGYNFLSPYIKCFIDNKIYNENSTSLQKENYQKKFFDIPYNMLKSLELNFEGGSGVNGILSLKIEDGSGVVGALLISTFYAMGSLQNNDGVPRISVEFGWAPKGRNKLEKNLEKMLLTKNQYSSFLITDIQLEFDDKYKQEITITAQQDTTGVYESISLKESQYKPFVIIGSQPTVSLRLIQYYYYFKKNKNNLLILLPKKFKGLKQLELEAIISDINSFIELNQVFPDIDIEKNNFLISTSNSYQEKLVQTQTFFNRLDGYKNDDDYKSIKTKFNQFLERSIFHPYVIFSYILNQFITTIKTLTNNIPVYIVRYYNENEIIDQDGIYNKITTDKIDTSLYCSEDVEIGTSKKADLTYSITNEFKIRENESWENLLNRIGLSVKIKHAKDKKTLTSNLFVTVRKYVKDIGDLNNTEDKSTGIKNDLKTNLIKKFNTLKDLYAEKKNKNGVKKIEKFIDFIEKQENDFIYIIITSGSPFLTDDNYKEKIIAQTYTVFPKISPDNRLEYQNFNSGSLDMNNESYADVIYFKPKLPFKEILASNLAKIEDITYDNGAFSFQYKNLEVENKNVDETKEQTQKKIQNILKKLTDFITKKEKSTITITVVQNNFFYLDDFKNIFFKSNEIDIISKTFYSDNNDDNKIISKFKSYLEGYLTTWKNGYHYSTLLNIIKKNNNIFIGDNNSIDYENYIFNANEYNKYLNKMSINFEAELKIIGEPAFSYDYGQLLHVFLNVNNYDGSINYLLTGLYSINKIKHEITESGSFTTTLSLRYDSPFTSEKQNKDIPDSKKEGVVK